MVQISYVRLADSFSLTPIRRSKISGSKARQTKLRRQARKTGTNKARSIFPTPQPALRGSGARVCRQDTCFARRPNKSGEQSAPQIYFTRRRQYFREGFQDDPGY